MIADILKAANLYDEGLKQVKNRREQWLKKHAELKKYLQEVAEYLNANAAYKQGFYIDTFHAFNEEINGTCADIPSVTFRSGKMPMLITFRNDTGEEKELTEEGFRVTFNPIITGQIMILLFPHYNEINKPDPPYATLAVIDEPGQITMDLAEQLIRHAMEAAFYSSFTGMGKQKDISQQADLSAMNQTPHHDIIGFKRYETTEKTI